MAKHREFKELIEEFEKEHPDTDLAIFAGPIRSPADDNVRDQFAGRRLRKNLVLMMTTYGGDPDVAYRIARCLQRSYGLLGNNGSSEDKGTITLFVDGVCASAGTLIALGATHLMMSNSGELSPIDVQIRKPDGIGERDSGLTPTQALDILERRSKSLFRSHFEQLRLGAGLGFTTKTSVEVASTITTGLLAPIYAQIDPMRLGEIERLMGITASYGERLAKHNCKDGALSRLLSSYPSHNFVIDRCEAEELFKEVRVPTKSLEDLAERTQTLSRTWISGPTAINFFLTAEPETVSEPAQRSSGADENVHQAQGADRAAPPGEGGGDGSRGNGSEGPGEAPPSAADPA